MYVLVSDRMLYRQDSIDFDLEYIVNQLFFDIFLFCVSRNIVQFCTVSLICKNV